MGVTVNHWLAGIVTQMRSQSFYRAGMVFNGSMTAFQADGEEFESPYPLQEFLTRVVEMVSVWSHKPRLGVRIPHPQPFLGWSRIVAIAAVL